MQKEGLKNLGKGVVEQNEKATLVINQSVGRAERFMC